MTTTITQATDPVTGFSFLDADGNIAVSVDADQVAQSIRERLRLVKGEWPYNITEGIDYFGEVFEDAFNLAKVESIFKTEILKTPFVTELTDFRLEYDRVNWIIKEIFFAVKTSFGTITEGSI